MNHLKSIKDNSLKYEVNLSTFNFGPVLCYTNLSKPFINELRVRGDNSKMDYRQTLAGHLDKENEYSQDDRNWFINSTVNIFKSYMDNL